MTEAFTWQLFDWMGTIAFAVSGAMVGLSKKMDMFGITVLAVLVAVGGGMTRDVIAGLTPPMALQHPTDLVIAIVTAFVVSIIYETVLIDSRRSVVNLQHIRYGRAGIIHGDGRHDRLLRAGR